MCTFRAWNVWHKRICNFWQFCWRLLACLQVLKNCYAEENPCVPPPPPPPTRAKVESVQRMNGYTNHWSLSRGYCVLSKTMVSLFFDWQENVQIRSNVSVQAFYFKMADRCTPSFTISLSNSLLSVATETVLKIVEFYEAYKTDTKNERDNPRCQNDWVDVTNVLHAQRVRGSAKLIFFTANLTEIQPLVVKKIAHLRIFDPSQMSRSVNICPTSLDEKRSKSKTSISRTPLGEWTHSNSCQKEKIRQRYLTIRHKICSCTR